MGLVKGRDAVILSGRDITLRDTLNPPPGIARFGDLAPTAGLHLVAVGAIKFGFGRCLAP